MVGHHGGQQALRHSHMQPPEPHADDHDAPVLGHSQYDIRRDEHQHPPPEQRTVAQSISQPAKRIRRYRIHEIHGDHDERRKRKLLVHARELARLAQATQREGMTVVPLKLYFNERGIAKLEIGLALGKKAPDKRDTEKKRDWAREKGRLLRQRG